MIKIKYKMDAHPYIRMKDKSVFNMYQMISVHISSSRDLWHQSVYDNALCTYRPAKYFILHIEVLKDNIKVIN